MLAPLHPRWRLALPAGFAVVCAAACSPDTDFLFGGQGEPPGGAGGSGEGNYGGFPTSSGVGAAPATTSTTTTTTTTTTGGSMVCGDGYCTPPEDPVTCARDCEIVCSHEVCSAGAPLALGCDPCVDQVCARDPFCCDEGWDDNCVGAADALCGAGCCGDGACDGEDCGTCEADCGECFCGDGACVQETCADCGIDCGFCTNCPHTVCFEGPPLDTTACFDPCVAAVCAIEPGCCDNGGQGYAFNAECQAMAAQMCPGGNPCVAEVCLLDPTCCTTAWTAACVALTVAECETTCVCDHSVCEDGGELDPACNPCVADVCATDDYCCNTAWDGICIDEVGDVCGVDCTP